MLLSCEADSERMQLESMFTAALRVANQNGTERPEDRIDFTPMLTEFVLTLGRQAWRSGRPIKDIEDFPSPTGEARYRIVALPLSDDDQSIDHVLCHVVRA